MTILRKAKDTINERFRQHLPERFYEKFNVQIETRYNVFAGALYSERTDGAAFTDEQTAFIAAFEDGYGLALSVLDEML